MAKSKKQERRFPFMTLTVRELREALEDEEDDAHVVLVADYGDHCHTQQALPIMDVTVTKMKESGYSASGWAVLDAESRYDEDDEDEDGEDRGTFEVVALGRP